MPKQTSTETFRMLTGEHPPKCAYLCGEDGAAVAQLEQRIIKKLTGGDVLAYTVFDGRDLDLERLAESSAFCSMFQPVNLLIIRDLDADLLPPSAMNTLMEILEGLGDRVLLLIVIRSLNDYTIKRGEPVFAPKVQTLVRYIEKNGVLCICEKKSPQQIGKQIQERAKRHGCEIAPTDAEELANRCLCDSILVHTELDKLMACADGSTITPDMIDALTAPQLESDAFQLARAVANRNRTGALQALAVLTARSEDSKTILGLLAILSGTFTDLYRAKAAQEAAKQASDLILDFGYPKNREFAVRNALQSCRSITMPQLRTCIQILRETDRACKSSRTPPKLLLEQAIVRMLHVQKDGSEVLR